MCVDAAAVGLRRTHTRILASVAPQAPDARHSYHAWPLFFPSSFVFLPLTSSPPTSHHHQGDIILVGLRDYQDEKADVILKYMADEARSLKSYGELPDNIRVNEADTFNDEENNDEYFDFDDTDDRQEAEDIDGDLGLGDLDVDDI